MGGSGSGKTTMLRLIGGQLKPTAGKVAVDGAAVHELDHDGCMRLRRRMGMLFQFGALFTDLTVFDNVAFPLREHTSLPEAMIRDLVLMKLNAVGLARCGAAEHRRAVRRHGAAGRAGARDRARSDAHDVRRAVHRSRSDFAGRDRQSDPALERRARRDLDRGDPRRQESLTIVDYVYFVSEGAHRGRRHAGRDPGFARSLRAPVRARRDRRPGGVPLPRRFLRSTISGWSSAHDRRVRRGLRHVGARVIDGVWKLGCATRFTWTLLRSVRDELPPPAAHAERDLLHRRAVAHHHHRVGPVRRHGAGAAGLRDAASATARPRRSGRWWRCRWCASSGRSCRRCCSPAGPARR